MRASWFSRLMLVLVSALAAGQEQSGYPELVLQTGHGAWVDWLAFSVEGDTLVSRAQDGSIKVWSVKTRSIRRSFQRDRVSSDLGASEPISVSKNGDRLLLGRVYGYMVSVPP